MASGLHLIQHESISLSWYALGSHSRAQEMRSIASKLHKNALWEVDLGANEWRNTCLSSSHVLCLYQSSSSQSDCLYISSSFFFKRIETLEISHYHACMQLQCDRSRGRSREGHARCSPRATTNGTQTGLTLIALHSKDLWCMHLSCRFIKSRAFLAPKCRFCTIFQC